MLIPLKHARAEQCGGKAAGLRRLLESGLSVPPGACLPLEVYRRALPPELPRDAGQASGAIEPLCRPVRAALTRWRPDATLNAALRELVHRVGWPLVVRSSASCEDRAIAAPGLFETVSDVSDEAQLAEAIRRCWASLWTAASWLVLRRHGRSPAGEAMGVVLQRQVNARCSGFAFSGEELLVEAVEGAGEALAGGGADPVSAAVPREGPATAGPLPLTANQLRALREAVLAAEAAWKAPVEVEWVAEVDPPGGPGLWLVQARAVRTSPAVEPRPDPPPGWRWDREHNPEPLSPAHAGLIERVDPGGLRTRVIEGYLFEAPVTAAPPPADSGARETLEPLWRRVQREIVPRIEALERGRPDLASALALFSELHRVYFGELSGARRRARRALVSALEERGVSAAERLAAELVSDSPEHETLERTRELGRLAALAEGDDELRAFLGEGVSIAACPSVDYRARLERHIARFGALFPVWDVAAPTLGERGDLVLRRLGAMLDAPRDPAPGRQTERPPDLAPDVLAEARLARRLEEDDDLLFARALRNLRRGLLALGGELARRGGLRRVDEVFLLTMPEALGEAALPDAAALDRRQERWRRQRERPPRVGRAGSGGELLRGLGVGGVARGEVRLVHRAEELLERDLRGGVVVCPTVLPALAVVLPEVAALVTDHGGLLSHAASLARELGVVAVVGTGRATQTLTEGQPVWVDGGRGLVVPE